MNKDTKIIKAVCGIVWVLSFVLIVGLVGGMENNDISLSAFLKLEAVCVVTLYASYAGIRKAEQIEDGRKVR